MTDSSKSFSEYNLQPPLLKAIEDQGYTKCTPIQERCLPLILNGQDIAGLAQTGTGKTAAFLIPLIDRVLRSQNPQPEDPRVFPDWQKSNFILVLVPTRELVSQVYENLQGLTKHTDLTSIFLYGGVGYDEQKEALSKPYQFLVSTPGRLIDLYKEKHLDFKQVRGVVFDEADRMFDMGFQQDVFFILRRIPQERQLLMFSATMNLAVTEMAYEAHSNPVEVNVSRDQATADNVEDFIFHVGGGEKPKYLLSLLKKHNPDQVIIFSNYKSKIPRIAQFLNDNGMSALGISSLMNQNQRNRVIERFKAENRHNILVATDLAARGLDIKGVDMVINFELPEDAENYVHRIGRTGRAEAKGKAFSFVSDKDVESLMRIEDYLKEKLEVIWMEDADFVPEADMKPFPPDESRRSAFPQRHDSRQGGGGGRDRGPRPPRREGGRPDRPPRRDGPRDDRPRGPRPDADPNANPLEARSNERHDRPDRGGERNVHRDRRSGRHRDNKNEGPRSEPRDAQGQPRREGQGPRDNNRRHQSFNGKKGGNRNQPRQGQGANRGQNPNPRRGAPPPKPKSTSGLWGKIKSFFK